MPKAIHCLLAATLLAAGCSVPPRNTPPAATAGPASLPDARDLAEHPLDVLAMPQP